MKNIYLIISLSIITLTTFSQGNNWKTDGNNNTDTTSFAGTTNNIPFILKSNNIEGVRLNTNGTIRIFSLDDNLTTGLVIADNTGVISKLSLTGNNDEVFTGAGSFISLSSLSGWSIYGNVLSSGNYNVGINTAVAPEKLTVNGNILANGSISGTSLNVVDIVTSGKKFKINTSVCISGIDASDPNSKNEICGMNGDLFIQSEQNNSYNTIFNYGNNGNVGIGTNQPTTKFEVNGDARFNGVSHFYRITAIPGDSIIRFGDSTLWMNTSAARLYSDNTGPYRGIGLGNLANGIGIDGIAIGYRTNAFSDKSIAIGNKASVAYNTTGAITIGTGTTTQFLINNIPNSLMIGFNSNIPTIFVSESAGNNTTGKVGIGTTCIPVGYTLAVNGKVIFEEAKVKLTDAQGCWPDYVFEKEYKKMNYLEKEKFFEQNKHLPDVKPASEIETDGLSVGETLQGITKNVEENSLEIIELYKMYYELKKENEELKKKVETLQNK